LLGSEKSISIKFIPITGVRTGQLSGTCSVSNLWKGTWQLLQWRKPTAAATTLI